MIMKYYLLHELLITLIVNNNKFQLCHRRAQ